jgi:hypothetical protein
VFSVPESYFTIADDTQEPTFYVPLGDVQAALTLPALKSGFDLGPDSNDARLLSFVEKGLGYVRRIHPGDSIPQEILDGTASWAVEERHRMLAESRLMVQLATWLAGKEAEVNDLTDLLKMASDPNIRGRVQEAVSEIAERLGIGRDRKGEVLDRVARLGRELSYVEALRDRFSSVRMIVMKLGQLADLYAADRGVGEEIGRILVLMRKPVGETDTLFAQVDAQTGEILSVLRKFDAQVKFIREARDDLHRRFMLWDDLIARWQDLTVAASPAAETLLRDTYRFMARHFPQSSDWDLQYGKLGKPRK